MSTTKPAFKENRSDSEESEEYYGGDISALIMNYQERSVLGKRKASVDLSASPESLPPAPKRILTKTVLPEETCSSSLTFPSPPGPPLLIAYSTPIHRMFEDNQISRGVRFELARLISAGLLKYDEITEEKVKACRGSNHKATSTIRAVFFSKTDDTSNDPAFAQEHAATSPWQELDREEEALSRGPYEGLGNSSKYPDWYGGKVSFRGKLLPIEGSSSKSYKIRLEACSLGASCRFSRRFGSWSFLRIKISENIIHDKNNGLIMFFRKLFVIWGQVFRACYAKGKSVFLFMTNETYPGIHGPVPGRMSFEEFIQWHNPIEENSGQLMTKWSARMPLGFSSSVPGPQILQENIHCEEDIVSAQGSDMTDGCGLSSRNIHSFLLYNRSLPSLPTAFQFRLAGHKGMSLIRDDGAYDDSFMQIWCRRSQLKIKHPKDAALDPAILTFDILRTSHMSTPARLTYETIINLAENGVPAHIFADLFKTGIRKIVTDLTSWDGPDAMYKLWTAVERAEGVIAARKAREAVGEARFRGYRFRSQEDDEDDEDELDEVEGFDPAQRSTAWWADQTSGCPSTLAETVMDLLASGFVPQMLPVLREKLKKVIINKIESRSACGKDIRLDLDYCAIAFVVPDPYNVLGPDEIHIKSSNRNFKTEDGLFSDIITGNVLITRNPCKVPSDVREVKAVDHPLLRNLVDVIVCSIQGHRRLLDFLAGGDYDGDTALVIWATGIVTNFKNADEKYSREPPGLDVCFTRDKESGTAFLQRVRTWEPDMRIQAMQIYLLGALGDPSIVGTYSNMHDNAVYELGYGNPRTVKLAAKFCRVLDGAKTGWRVKDQTAKGDRDRYLRSLGPKWKAKKQTDPYRNNGNLIYLKRKQTSEFIKGTFIMDVLVDVALKERKYLLGELEKLFKELPLEPDLDLFQPWNEAEEWAARESPGVNTETKKDDLDIIAAHVRRVYGQHSKLMSPKTPNNLDVPGASFSSLPIEVRQDGMRSISRNFNSFPQVHDLQTIPDQATIARLRASYAFKYDAEQNARKGGWSRFPWTVASRELCTIKATKLGPSKTVTNNFYEKFRIPRIH